MVERFRAKRGRPARNLANVKNTTTPGADAVSQSQGGTDGARIVGLEELVNWAKRLENQFNTLRITKLVINDMLNKKESYHLQYSHPLVIQGTPGVIDTNGDFTVYEF